MFAGQLHSVTCYEGAIRSVMDRIFRNHLAITDFSQYCSICTWTVIFLAFHINVKGKKWAYIPSKSFSFFIFLRSLARDELGPPGEVIMDFSEGVLSKLSDARPFNPV